MKIAYLSVSPLVDSGYGRCTREVVYGLLKEHEVDVFAYYGLQKCTLTVSLSGDEGDREVRIVGGDGTIYHPILPEVQDKYDVIVAHYDMWMSTFSPWLEKITTPIIWWAIVDQIPLPHPTRRLLMHPSLLKAVPMSKFGEAVLKAFKDAGDVVSEPIPHGVDLKTFYPDCTGKYEDEVFRVISVVANHGPRENIPTMIEGFALFLKNCKADAVYHIHTDPVSNSGYNLYEVISSIEELHGIDLSGKISFRRGMATDDDLRRLYSCSHCQLMCVMGGSFELPVLEAGACKTPSVVGGFSAPVELIGDFKMYAGRKVEIHERGIAVLPSAYQWMNLSSAKYAQYNPVDIAKALEEYYFNSKLLVKHGEAMRKFAEGLSWDYVRERWLELLRGVEDDLGCF